MHKLLYFVILVFLASCSSEKPAGVEGKKLPGAGGADVPKVSESGRYSLQIVPANVTRNSTIYAVAHGFSLSDAKTGWFVNGIRDTGSVINEFKAKEAKKGDKIQMKAVIKGKEVLSNVIQIENSLPVVSKVRILPEVFKPGDTLSVEASGSDLDEYDNVTISYEWTKNGEPAGNTNKIKGHPKRGDKIDVKITPFDGEAYGRPIILHRDIKNMPPAVAEYKEVGFDGKIYSCQVTATDPDNDALTYSLKTAPPDMTIDPSTGLIKWNVPPDFKGRMPITVSVNDGHGGEALQGLTVDIEPEKK
jgi:Putative Ig domain